ncbi:tripartite tricarboxylate transporter TctB family protein [Agrococcus sp. Marseille-P2731]|uniref:tripartite tricarboxylate transporter TctB family protein n=1 Tax=Agrococcus sp. Marseille-P2731 TaxID=1841862 RepID=UPI0009F8213B|nr:tripartite tricarboxylate transporter TctB family protein [Agrococcus sp. Marseille-P2731]
MKSPSPTEALEPPIEDTEHPTASRRTEVIIAIVAIAFMAAAIVLAQGIELRREPAEGQIGARFWPSLLAIVGLALAIWRLVIAIVSAPDDRSDQEVVSAGGYRRLALTLLLTIAFIALWSIRSVVAFGFRFEVFPVLCALFLVGLVWLYGGRGWKALVLFPALLTAGIYVIFHVLLRIPL